MPDLFTTCTVALPLTLVERDEQRAGTAQHDQRYLPPGAVLDEDALDRLGQEIIGGEPGRTHLAELLEHGAITDEAPEPVEPEAVPEGHVVAGDAAGSDATGTIG